MRFRAGSCGLLTWLPDNGGGKRKIENWLKPFSRAHITCIFYVESMDKVVNEKRKKIATKPVARKRYSNA